MSITIVVHHCSYESTPAWLSDWEEGKPAAVWGNYKTLDESSGVHCFRLVVEVDEDLDYTQEYLYEYELDAVGARVPVPAKGAIAYEWNDEVTDWEMDTGHDVLKPLPIKTGCCFFSSASITQVDYLGLIDE